MIASFLNVIVLLFLSLVTISFLPHFAVFNTSPILTLCFVVALSYFRKGVEPLILASLAGLLLDVFSAYVFGFYTFFFLVTAVIIKNLSYNEVGEISFFRHQLINFIVFAFLFIFQTVALFFEGVRPEVFALFYPAISFILVNMVAVTVMFYLVNFYFDKTKELDFHKKRK